MKAYQLMLLAFLINNLAFGQVEKVYFAERKQFVVEANGELYKGRDGGGFAARIGPTPPKPFPSIAPYTKEEQDYYYFHAYQTSGSVGYMVTSRLLVSFGVNHVESTAIGRTDNVMERRADNSTLSGGGDRYFNYSSTTPFAEIRYFIPLSNKFFFAPSIQFASGTRHYIHHEAIDFNDYPASGLDPKHTRIEALLDSKASLKILQVSPVLYYRATSWMGAKLSFGGFTVRDDRAFSILNNPYTLSFNPSAWQLSLYTNFRLPRKL